LKDRRSKDNEVFGKMWEAVEIKVGKIRVAKIKGRRSKGGS